MGGWVAWVGWVGLGGGGGMAGATVGAVCQTSSRPFTSLEPSTVCQASLQHRSKKRSIAVKSAVNFHRFVGAHVTLLVMYPQI